MTDPEDVTVALSEDEAYVFYDWLRRVNLGEPAFVDQAEERVLWDIECILEQRLSGGFADSGDLERARAAVRDPTD